MHSAEKVRDTTLDDEQ